MSELGRLTTDAVRRLLEAGAHVVALVPVGSVEPHGPHLPLATDTIIGQRAAEVAVTKLAAAGVTAVVGPPVPYGVTQFADGFAGAISIPSAPLVAFLRAVAEGYLAAGFRHVCFVNNHLEPAHDAAVRDAVAGLPAGRASVASPLTRRWGRTLSAEFKSGACHAGRYETSLVLAAAPADVDAEAANTLPPLDASLSDAIREGKKSFRELGMERAYTGAPAEATSDEGHELYERLAEMITGETLDALASV
jgi:creatinine amidohydrolase